MKLTLNKILFYFMSSLPNFMWPLKTIILRFSFAAFGKNSRIPYQAYFAHPNNVIIKNNVFIGNNFYCSTIDKLVIHDRVMFGANCSIIGGDHAYNNPNVNMRFNNRSGINNQIVIEEDAWIGHGSVILKRAFIREGVIVGANSLINSETLPYSVYAGQPAKFIKPRFDTIEKLEVYLNMMKKEFDFSSKYDLAFLKNIYLKNG